jgi:hypothetical protein
MGFLNYNKIFNIDFLNLETGYNKICHDFERVIDCCLTPIQQFFSYMYIMARTSLFSMRWWWGPLCTRPTRWVGFLVLAHWNNSSRVDMALHSDTLSWFRANQSLLFLLNAACWAEKQQIPILYSLVWPDRGSNPRSTTLTITLPIRLVTILITWCSSWVQ